MAQLVDRRRVKPEVVGSNPDLVNFSINCSLTFLGDATGVVGLLPGRGEATAIDAAFCFLAASICSSSNRLRSNSISVANWRSAARISKKK